MKIAFFSSHSYDVESMERAAKLDAVTPTHELQFLAARLDVHSAKLAEGCEGVCLFVNDVADADALRALHAGGTRVIFLRCAGFDRIDLQCAKEELGMPVLRVPAYSPYAVAEHAAALMMTLNRKIHRSYNRTREQNFRLEGLLGFDVHGKTVGVSPEAQSYGAEYESLDEVWARSDIVSLHCPLTPSTKHTVNTESISKMKDNVMIINTSHGGLIDTKALVNGLKSRKIGSVGLDVFEGEGDYFYSDCSGGIIADNTLARLFTFPNVIITGHQAFFTEEALDNISYTTMSNIQAYSAKEELVNEVK
uniref:D-lactate dehydrogenase n=1 Tax=Peronospora matthiolae TaxID=2874970 RepID=A0AAV1TKI5_9STRA